jgi:integrase
MAALEYIYYQPMKYEPDSVNAEYGFVPNLNRKSVESFPQIYLSDGEPWREANRYAFYRLLDLQKDIQTVHREMSHLSKYADWLEDTGLHWLHFPKRKAERCLFRFRGYLIECRDEGLLAPSTTSQVMNSVLAFYRWSSANGYAEARAKLFDDTKKTISFFDKVGFSRSMSVTSSELSIPNRARAGARLEDGLTPINESNTKILMSYLANHRNYELYLMHKVALMTGCRHGTITTLNIDALRKAHPDATFPELMKVKVGPGTGVQTKGDVSGEVYFAAELIAELNHYFASPEAILRRSKAKDELQKKVFLTSRGNRYTNQTFGTLLHRLKSELTEDGYTQFGRFKFHQLRATFGTMLMRAALVAVSDSQASAIEFVRDAMLHKEESTTWKYIKFIEKEPVEEAFLETLWKMFTGSKKESHDIVERFTNHEMLNDE